MTNSPVAKDDISPTFPHRSLSGQSAPSQMPTSSFKAVEPGSVPHVRLTLESNKTLPSGRPCYQSGWLRKQSKYLGSWRKRWMVLTGNAIESYKNESCTGPPTVKILLDEIIGVDLGQRTAEPNTVRVRLKDEYEMMLAADSEADAAKWAGLLDLAAVAARRRAAAEKAFAAARTTVDMEIALAEARAAGTGERTLQGFAKKLEERKAKQKPLQKLVEEMPEDFTASVLSGVPQELGSQGYARAEQIRLEQASPIQKALVLTQSVGTAEDSLDNSMQSHYFSDGESDEERSDKNTGLSDSSGSPAHGSSSDRKTSRDAEDGSQRNAT